MRITIRFFIAGFVSAALLAGCGKDGEESSPQVDGQSAGTAKTPAVEPPQVSAGSVVPELTPEEVEKLTHQARYERALAYEHRGLFGKALSEASPLNMAPRAVRRELRLPELMNRLRERQNQAGGLQFALQRLGTYSSMELGTVRRKIQGAGDTGTLMLVRVIREEGDEVFEDALDLLEYVDEDAVARACVERLLEQPHTQYRARCLELATQRADTLGLLGSHTAYEAALNQRQLEDSNHLRAATVLGLAADLKPEWLQSLALRAVSGVPTETRRFLPFLGLVFHFGAGGSDEKFAAMIGDAGLLFDIREAAEDAGRSDNSEVADAGRLATRLLTPRPLEGLESKLVGRWTFRTPKWPFLPEDPKNLVMDYNRVVEKEQARRLLSGDFTITAWVRPGKLPAGKQTYPFGTIARKKGWSMALMLNEEGKLVFMVTFMGGDGIVTCKSKDSLKVGQWSHIAATMNRSTGQLVITIDGEESGTAKFNIFSGLASKEDSTRPFTALGLQPGSTDGCRFQGDVDDLRIYRRILTRNDYQVLQGLGHIWKW